MYLIYIYIYVYMSAMHYNGTSHVMENSYEEIRNGSSRIGEWMPSAGAKEREKNSN